MNHVNGKRIFDLAGAFAGLCALSPLFVGIALLIKMEDGGPVFFSHQRIGRDFKPFGMFKFRTMKPDIPPDDLELSLPADRGVTRIGHYLRRSKLNELPQLINVLRGQMSLVGPRPEVGQYVRLFEHNYRTILQVRPGITDFASLEYIDESDLLARSDNIRTTYIQEILPKKLELNLRYIERQSMTTDLVVLISTLRRLLKR